MAGDLGEPAEVVVPWRGDESAPLPKRGEATPGSAILDANLGEEGFLAIFSRAPVTAEDAFRWLDEEPPWPEAGPASISGEQVEVVTIRFAKEAP